MRLLVLSSKRQRHINDLIHRGFFESFPGEVYWYGLGEKLGLERPLYETAMTIQPDLVLVNMKKRVERWIRPNVIACLPFPKAIVEVDYCYERGVQNTDWYERCQFDMHFFRNYVDVLRAPFDRRGWLPFSVHPDWLCEPTLDERPHTVAFAGTVKPAEHYPMRRWAIEALQAHIPPKRLNGLRYMQFWRSTLIGLTCTSAAKYDNAKHVIIPGAGALLLTDGTLGTERLLGSNYLRYDKNLDSLRANVQWAIDQPEYALQKRKAAYDLVATNHTHAARWDDLLRAMLLKPL